jgi:hypothetical protein
MFPQPIPSEEADDQARRAPGPKSFTQYKHSSESVIKRKLNKIFVLVLFYSFTYMTGLHLSIEIPLMFQ